jgi:hypothetical protein
MRGFVRDEFIPLETLDLEAAAFSCAADRRTATAHRSPGSAAAYRYPADL